MLNILVILFSQLFSMSSAKANIISQLQKSILSLQGIRSITNGSVPVIIPIQISDAFPNASFPLGAVHEFISTNPEDQAATAGYVAGLLGSLMRRGGVSIWINSSATIFPPSLTCFGIDPEKIVFIQLEKEKEILWTLE